MTPLLDVEDLAGTAPADGQFAGAQPLDRDVAGEVQLAAGQGDGLAFELAGEGDGVAAGGVGDLLPERSGTAVIGVADDERAEQGADLQRVERGGEPPAACRGLASGIAMRPEPAIEPCHERYSLAVEIPMRSQFTNGTADSRHGRRPRRARRTRPAPRRSRPGGLAVIPSTNELEQGHPFRGVRRGPTPPLDHQLGGLGAEPPGRLVPGHGLQPAVLRRSSVPALAISCRRCCCCWWKRSSRRRSCWSAWRCRPRPGRDRRRCPGRRYPRHWRHRPGRRWRGRSCW